MAYGRTRGHRRRSAPGGHNYRIINSSHNVDYPATQAGLQAAIDALPASGGWVRGPGPYVQIVVTAAITVPSNVKLEKVDIYVDDGANCNGIENSDPVAGNEYIEISECRVDANWENQTATNNGIYLENCDYSWVHDCIIRGGRRVLPLGGEGVYFESCNHSRMSHNFAHDSYYDDLKAVNCSYCLIDNNVCWGASQASGGIQIGSGFGNEVSDNVVYKTGESGLGHGIKVHSDTNSLIADNWIRCQTDGVALIEASDFCLIEGNYIYRTQYGVHFRLGPAKHCRVMGNYIFSYTGPRIGIWLEYGQDHVIRENTVTGFEAEQVLVTGIQIDAACTDIRIIDNEGLWLTTGIVDAGTRTVIKSNPLLESVSQGLYQSAAAFAAPTGTFDPGDLVLFEETTTGTVRIYARDSAGWHFFNQDG